jgi:hypothetical protein
MTASRASGAVFALALALGAPAAAQTAPGAPVPLGPAVVAPQAPPSALPGQAPRAAPGRTDLPVSVDKLAAVDPDSVGLIGDGDGGLGVAMWRGTSRAFAVELVGSIPAPVASPAMRSLARRLLLTTATAPEGKSDDGPLLLARAKKLTELGVVADASELIRAAPAGASDERMAQLEVEGLFYANDNSGACARVRGADFQSGYWQRALAYCLALAGEGEKATVISDLLRERGGEGSTAFFGLIDAVTGDKSAKIDLPAEPSALELSMMRAASRKLPDAVAQSSRAAVLRVMALSPNADLAARLAAAERAAELGAIDPAQLAEINAGVPFTPEDVSKALSIAESQWGSRARSLLLRAALGQSVPAARMEALKRGFSLAHDKGGLAAFRVVILPALEGFAPSGETMPVAADVGTTLYDLGRAKDAGIWYAAVERAAPSNEDAARAWTALWPPSQLAVKPGEWDKAMVAKWRAAQGPAGNEAAGRARAATVFALFEALNQPFPSEAWTGLLGGPKAEAVAPPDPALIYALDHVAREGRRAETVALALQAIGPGGPAAASPLALGVVASALSRVGLEGDARALAVEAACGG